MHCFQYRYEDKEIIVHINKVFKYESKVLKDEFNKLANFERLSHFSPILGPEKFKLVR